MEFLCHWESCVCIAEVFILISEGGEILIQLHLALIFFSLLYYSHLFLRKALSYLITRWHINLYACTSMYSVPQALMLLLDISLEEFLLIGSETSSDRNLGPLVGFIFLSLYWQKGHAFLPLYPSHFFLPLSWANVCAQSKAKSHFRLTPSAKT